MSTRIRASLPRPSGEVALVGGMAALGAATFLVLVPPVGGTVLLSLSGSHGINLGDLVTLPLVFVGVWLLGRTPIGAAVSRWRVALQRQGGDLMTLALLASGASLALVDVFAQIDASGTEAGILPVVVSVVSLSMLGLLLSEPGADEDTFGLPLWIVVVVLAAGLTIDAQVPILGRGDEGSVFGPTLLAGTLTWSLGRRRPAVAVALGMTTLLYIVLDAAAVFNSEFLDTRRELNNGGVIRTGSVGLLLLVVGVLRIVAPTRTAKSSAEPSRPPSESPDFSGARCFARGEGWEPRLSPRGR